MHSCVCVCVCTNRHGDSPKSSRGWKMVVKSRSRIIFPMAESIGDIFISHICILLLTINFYYFITIYLLLLLTTTSTGAWPNRFRSPIPLQHIMSPPPSILSPSDLPPPAMVRHVTASTRSSCTAISLSLSLSYQKQTPGRGVTQHVRSILHALIRPKFQ